MPTIDLLGRKILSIISGAGGFSPVNRGVLYRKTTRRHSLMWCSQETILTKISEVSMLFGIAGVRRRTRRMVVAGTL